MILLNIYYQLVILKVSIIILINDLLISFNSSAISAMAEEPTPSTQEGCPSKVKYAWIILFNYDINEPEPFSIVPLSSFVGSNFPWNAVEGFLSSEARIKRRVFSNFPDKVYTIFAKVEIGKCCVIDAP